LARISYLFAANETGLGQYFKKITIGDISFFVLRIATILGGITWLSLAFLSAVSAPFLRS
jgi:hypothetical protein